MTRSPTFYTTNSSSAPLTELYDVHDKQPYHLLGLYGAKERRLVVDRRWQRRCQNAIFPPDMETPAAPSQRLAATFVIKIKCTSLEVLQGKRGAS